MKIFKKLCEFLHADPPTIVRPNTIAHDWGAGEHTAIPGSECPLLVASPTSKFFPTTRIYNMFNSLESIFVGDYTCVRGELLTFPHAGNITIGDYCYIGEGTRIWSAESIKIGNRVLISHNVNIFDSDTHPIDDYEARHQQFKDIITTGHPRTLNLREKPVIIEDDVLIACQSIILKGVTIGKGAVIGAGSVVTQNVAPFTLVAGNPARVIRDISPPEHNHLLDPEA